MAKIKLFEDISYEVRSQAWATSKETQEVFYNKTGFELTCVNRYTLQYRKFIEKGIYKRILCKEGKLEEHPKVQILLIGEVSMRFDFENKTMEYVD